MRNKVDKSASEDKIFGFKILQEGHKDMHKACIPHIFQSSIGQLLRSIIQGSDEIPYYLLKTKLIHQKGDYGPNGQLIVTKTFEDGSKYQGELINSVMDGEGRYDDREANYRYYGQFKQGLKEGEGVCELPNGDFYMGGFKDDKMHGMGVYYYAETGNRVKGDIFRDGKIEGNGFFNWTRDSKAVYKGEIKDGFPNGKGRLRSKCPKFEFLAFLSF